MNKFINSRLVMSSLHSCAFFRAITISLICSIRVYPVGVLQLPQFIRNIGLIFFYKPATLRFTLNVPDSRNVQTGNNSAWNVLLRKTSMTKVRIHQMLEHLSNWLEHDCSPLNTVCCRCHCRFWAFLVLGSKISFISPYLSHNSERFGLHIFQIGRPVLTYWYVGNGSLCFWMS